MAIISEKVVANNIDDLYKDALALIIASGDRVSPRGQETRELVGQHLVLTNPRANVLLSPTRKPNYHFMVAEWLWMLLGFNTTDMIVPYNSSLAPFSDDGETFRGAYGPKLVDQLPYIIQTLQDDSYSRQAVLTIWRERPGPSKDIPCTVMMQFLIREDNRYPIPVPSLDMLVYMRSNDAWLGLPYDVFNFTQLQAYLAMKLGVGLGTYHHMVGSLHLYEKHWEKAEQVIEEEDQGLILSPVMTEMPSAFKSVFTGITLMSKHAETAEEMISWVTPTAMGLPSPWSEYLMLLAHRFHKQDDVLPERLRRLVGRS